MIQTDVILRARDASRGSHDVQAFSPFRSTISVKLYARDNSRGAHDVQLRPADRVIVTVAGGPAFPTQYEGFRVGILAAGVLDLCAVLEADYATGMGGVPKFTSTGGNYAAYLVDTGDTNASAVRVQTTTGTMAIRKKT